MGETLAHGHQRNRAARVWVADGDITLCLFIFKLCAYHCQPMIIIMITFGEFQAYKVHQTAKMKSTNMIEMEHNETGGLLAHETKNRLE